MNYYFLFVQGIDVVAWIILFISYYKKNTNKVLVFQLISTTLFIFHYWLLGAYSGSFICLFELLRDYLYYRTDKDKPIFLLSIPFYGIFSYFSYHSLFDLFPVVSSLIDGYSLTFSNKFVVVIGGFFSYFLWIIYDFFVGSYTGMITDSLIVISNACILLFSKRENSKLFNKINMNIK